MTDSGGGCSWLRKNSNVSPADNYERKHVVFLAALLSLLEYHCILWYQLDLPVHIYENFTGVVDILRRLTQTDNPLFQFLGIAVLYQWNTCFLRRGFRLLEKNDWILSFLLSFVLVVGYSYDQTDSLALISWNTVLVIATIGCFLAYGLLSAAIVSVLRISFEGFAVKDRSRQKIWERHPFLFPMMILFLAWLPYALVRYPAGMECDAFEQIQQVLTGELRANNPLLSTLFFGYGFVLGRNLFGSINAGLFLWWFVR